MTIAGSIAVGMVGIIALAGSGMGGVSVAPTTGPATTAAASASAPATRPKRPAAAEILSRKTVNFDFVAAPLNDVLQFVGKNFDVGIENVYDMPDLITIRNTFDAVQAINMLNTSLEPMGYALVQSVRDDQGAPRVFLTVTQIKKDAGRPVPVFRGMDPATIPEGNEVRTQIMTVKQVDLEKYRDMITAVLGKDAIININAETKTLMVTDTATHIHTVATILQVLDNQAAGGGK